jgi:LysR family transcriptional regulator, nitrogen assimilation regulatory protein
VVETGNMTAAAESLKIAQPALGMQVRQLEQELGVDLLVRHSRGVAPTEAGKKLHQRAYLILSDVDALRDEMKAMGASGPSRIRIGLSATMAHVLGPDLLIKARHDMPDMMLTLIEERSVFLVDALLQNNIDIAFAYNVEEHPDLIRRAVLEEDLLLIKAPTEGEDLAPVSLAHALEHELVIAGERGIIRQIVQSEASRLSLPLKIAFEVPTIMSMKAIIERGAGASIMPYSLASDEIKRGTLVGLRIDRPALTRTLYLVRNAKSPPAIPRHVLDPFLEFVEAQILGAFGTYARPLR